MMNIAVVIPIHKREELARRVIGYYKSLDVRGLRLFVVPVLSDLECDLWNELTPPKMFSLNEPLAAKFNKGIDACRMLDIEGVMIVGSDDLIAPWVFEGVAKKDPFIRRYVAYTSLTPRRGSWYSTTSSSVEQGNTSLGIF